MESDDTLVVRSRDAGDADAFAERLGRYRGPVFRLTLSILGQGFAAEAEEVTQDVMLRVHHGLQIVSRRREVQLVDLPDRVQPGAQPEGARALPCAPRQRRCAGNGSAETDTLNELETGRRKRAVLDASRSSPRSISQRCDCTTGWVRASPRRRRCSTSPTTP